MLKYVSNSNYLITIYFYDSRFTNIESENPLKYEIGGNLCNDATISFLRSERLGAKRI